MSDKDRGPSHRETGAVIQRAMSGIEDILAGMEFIVALICLLWPSKRHKGNCGRYGANVADIGD